MVPQGLPLLAAALPTQLLSVEQGLSVLGDVVLLVRVEQGLTPWLATVHCKVKKNQRVTAQQAPHHCTEHQTPQGEEKQSKEPTSQARTSK